MYDGDSFFTLSNAGQAGLALLSLALAIVSLVVAGRLFRLVPNRGLAARLAARLGVAIFVMWLFVWLSPQIYYLYYLTLFDGLPWQIVVQNPPEFHAILQQVTFSGPETLSAHAKGALAWLLILYASAHPLWQQAMGRRAGR